MKKKFLVTRIIILAVFVIGIGVLSVFNSVDKLIKHEEDDSSCDESQKSQEQKLIDEKNEISAELDKQIAAGQLNDNDSSQLTREDFYEIDLNRDALQKEEEKLNQMDLNAYPILAKYCGEEYSRDELVTDYDMDISYMEKMCELINSGDLSENEKETLYNYVDRRTGLIEDEALREHFVQSIGAPY
ncbi:MAG: hypothetical protein ACI4I6_10955 [Hominimerdicola sp.]